MSAKDKLVGLVQDNAAYATLLLVALLVVVIIMIYMCWKQAAAKEGMSGRFWASGGGACALQSSDDIRFANSGCSAGAEGYINASVTKKDRFVPGPEQKDADGNVFVIDSDTGKKWYVMTIMDLNTKMPKKVYTETPPMPKSQATTILQQWGVDPNTCVVTDEGQMEDAWGWLTGQVKSPADGEGMSDTKLIRVTHGY